MSSIGVIWGIVKIAAEKIPWGRVMENAPAVVDMVGRAKDRFRAPASSPHDLEEQLKLIQEKNLKLEKALLQSSDHLQALAKSLKVVSARQKILAIATVVSLLIAVFSLALWALK